MRIYIKMVCLFLSMAHFGLHAQSGKNIFEADLWIKGKEIKTDSHPETISENQYFNYNPVVDFSKNDFQQSHKNLVKKEGSLFVVFQSLDESEVTLLTLTRSGFKVVVGNKKIQSDKEIKITKGDPEKGIVLSYINKINSSNSRKNGKLVIDDLFYYDKEGKNQVMEMLYFQKCLNERQKSMVDSYLSIKYGISQNGEKDYYDADYNKLWDCKESGGFNSRITGLGRNDLTGLLQKQSGNSEKEGLYIGLKNISQTNAKNTAVIPDKSFLLWGDNNQSLALEDNGRMKTMKRIWKMRSVAESSLTTQLVIDKSEMAVLKAEKPMPGEITWLAIDTTASSDFDYTAAKFIKPSTDDPERLIFNDLVWKAHASAKFTFVKAPEFEVLHDLTKPDCLAGLDARLTVKIIGGVAPYRVRFASAGFTKSMTIQGDNMSLKDVPVGSYTLEVTDSMNNNYSENLVIDGFEDGEISLAARWTMDENGEVRVIPQVSHPEAIVSFAWSFGDKIVSVEKEFLSTTAGSYILTVENLSGCKKELPFEVLDSDKPTNGEWVIFPNPAKVSENFFISFHLKAAANVTVAIADLNGKIIKSRNLGTIVNAEWKESLQSAGTYLIMVTRNGATETRKLIIQ